MHKAGWIGAGAAIVLGVVVLGWAQALSIVLESVS